MENHTMKWKMDRKCNILKLLSMLLCIRAGIAWHWKWPTVHSNNLTQCIKTYFYSALLLPQVYNNISNKLINWALESNNYLSITILIIQARSTLDPPKLFGKITRFWKAISNVSHVGAFQRKILSKKKCSWLTKYTSISFQNSPVDTANSLSIVAGVPRCIENDYSVGTD